jgi:hypothetical protein
MSDCNSAWIDMKSIASFDEKLDNYGTPIRQNDYTKELMDTTAKCLIIRMNVVDSQLCHGPSINVTVSLTSNVQHESGVKHKISILQIHLRSNLSR